MIQDRWESPCGGATVLLGDSLTILPMLGAEQFDAVVTDPPYSSGGAFRSDRTQKTVEKYVRHDTGVSAKRQEFSGDSRDQRSMLAWCSLWMAGARRCTNAGGVMACFSDWRQVPVMTDALQCGGWVWRNLGVWYKPGVRMQAGRFSSSAEYVLYGTNGPHAADGEKSPQNVFTCAPVGSEEKQHIAEKPLAVMSWLMGLVRPAGAVLDPFCGSGQTGVAAIQAGRSFVGIEVDSAYFSMAVGRLKAALREAQFLRETSKTDQRRLMLDP